MFAQRGPGPEPDAARGDAVLPGELHPLPPARLVRVRVVDRDGRPLAQVVRRRLHALGARLERVLVHPRVPQPLQVPPVERALAGARGPAEQDELLRVFAREDYVVVVVVVVVVVILTIFFFFFFLHLAGFVLDRGIVTAATFAAVGAASSSPRERKRGYIEIPHELARRLPEEVLLGRLVRHADVVREVAIRAAEILRDGRLLCIATTTTTTTAPSSLDQHRSPAPRIAHENAPLAIDLPGRDVVVLADLVPHARPRLAVQVAPRRRVHGRRDVELREHGPALLLELGDAVLAEVLGAFRLRVRVRVEGQSALVAEDHDAVVLRMVELAEARGHRRVEPFPVCRVVAVAFA